MTNTVYVDFFFFSNIFYCNADLYVFFLRLLCTQNAVKRPNKTNNLREVNVKYLHSPTNSLNERLLDPRRSYTAERLVRATLRVSDVTDKWNSWMADVTFDWRHAMVTAVECNNQTRLFTTFLRWLFCIRYIETSQKMNKNGIKRKCKY